MTVVSPGFIATYLSDTKFLNKVPVLGNWNRRIGTVLRAYATPCATTPMIWIEALALSAPRLAYLYTKPFLQAEEAYRFFNSRCRNRGIIKKFSLALGLQDPVANWANSPEGVALNAFKVLGDFALKAQWYLFVIDRATEFAYNWVSLVYTWEGCPLEGEAYADMVAPDGTLASTVTGFYDGWSTAGEYEMVGGVDKIIENPPEHVHLAGTAFFNLGIGKLPGAHAPQPFSARLSRQPDGATSEWMEAKPDKDGNLHANGALYYNGEVAVNYSWSVEVKEKYLIFGPAVNCHFQAYAFKVGKAGLLYDP